MIRFVRLPEVELDQVVRLVNEPRNARHMPLAGTFTPEETAAWVAAKDAQWETYGYGPWAVLIDGDFAGWGGFQHEANGADLGLVLLPEHWGAGTAITQQMLTVGFTDLDLDAVLIALPPTRRSERAVARFGFLPDGEVSYGGVTFGQYRLTRELWLRVHDEISSQDKSTAADQGFGPRPPQESA